MVHLKEKKMISEKWKIYTYDTAIENGQVHHTLKFKNQDFHDLFLETLFWINLCPAKN